MSAATIAAASIPRFVHAAPSPTSAAETVVAEFYQSLSDGQRKEICRPFGDELRSRVSANWHVTKPQISDDFYSDSQRAMIEKIVRGVTSADGFKRLEEQMEYDDGGLGAYSVAIFGEPNAGQFQWLLTGRHLTLRADGNTLEGRAFGGPIVYGHGEESSAVDNLFYYQTKRVNEVFAALDKPQAATALKDKPPAENQVALQGAAGQFAGIAVSELGSDQQQLVRDVLGTILAPYREEDSQEAMSIIDANGGIGSLRFAFYKNNDLENDGIWDIWRIEGPNAVIHFRGAPHVHAYIHIGDAKQA
ncbi:MAG: DUF3500 domain-containing protein [Planctomycetaceae bacterium]